MLAPILLLLSPQLQVEGLRATDSLVELAPAVAAELAEAERWVYFQGRVLGAFNGLPVEGATVETWSEEITEPTEGLHRFGEAVTRASGQFRVRVREGDLMAEKARVMAPGYATLSTVPGELMGEVYLFPANEVAPRLRFLDSSGRPILNGTITSTRTCAHDLAAFTLHSDAQGVFTLPAYAFQDEIPELRFHAPGYLGIKYLASEAFFTGARARGAVLDWHRPRTQQPQVRLADEDGVPLSRVALRVIDAGNHLVVRTSQSGQLPLPGRYSTDDLAISRMANQNHQDWSTEAWMNGLDDEFFLRKDGERWDEEMEQGTVALKLPSDLPEDVSLSFGLVHERGWLDGISQRSEPEWEATFPEGSSHLGWGAPFHQLLPGNQSFELEEGQRLELKPQLEFAVLFEFTRPEEVDDLWFEVDSASIMMEYNDSEVWLPRGKPWRLGFRYRGESLVFDRPPLQGDTRFDFASLLPQEHAELSMSEVEIRFPGGIDLESSDYSGFRTADWSDELPEPEQTDQGWLFRGPAGHQFIVAFEVAGHLDRWVRTTFPTQGNTRDTLALDLVKAATLQIDLPEDWELQEGPIDLDKAIPPGAAEFVVIAPDGRRWGLTLDLLAGEARTLRFAAD
jgi:hypothetical protein